MKKTTFLKGIKSVIAVVLFGISSLGNAQTNIAPLATATANGSAGNGCSSGACSTLNDLNFGTCGSQQMWISTSPPNAIGVDYIEFDFPITQTFDSIIIHHADAATRFLSGGLVQVWDGTMWVSHSSFTGLPMQCISRIYIGKVSSDRVRITSFEISGSQLSNPSFREIEIISAPNGTNDAAVFAVDSPSVFCPGSQDIYATVGNYGLNQLDSVTIDWEFDGVAQNTIKYVGLLDTVNGLFDRTALIFLGTKTFNAGTISEIKVWTSMPNAVADTISTNDTLTVNRGPSLPAGIYTIDANSASSITNFQSFTEFDSVISKVGICGDVTVNVVPLSGPYIEQVNISDFDGAPGRALTINGNGELVSFAATVSAERATFGIENSSYITVNDLSIEATGTTYGVALYMNGINNVTINNSSFTVDSTSTSSNYSCVRISGSQTSQASATEFDSLVFTNNTIVGGYYGLSMYGLNGTPSQGVSVSGNNIRGFYYYGNYLYYTDGMVYELNDISRPNRSTLTTCYGLYSFGSSNLRMNRNEIHHLYDGNLTSSSTCYALYSANDATLGNENYITNNIIHNINHNGTIYAIYDGGSDYTKYYNNTVSLDNANATGGTTRGVYHTGATTGLEFQNNVFSITRGGSGTKHGLYLNSSPATVDHNNVYLASAGSGSQSYAYVGSDLATLNDFQGLGFGASDITSDPLFTNILVEDFTPTNLSLNAAGFSTTQVTEDFNGVPRIATANDIGAFDIASAVLDAAVKSIEVGSGVFCAGTQPVVVTVANNGSARLNSLMVNWSIDGVTQTPVNYTTMIDTIGSVAGNSAQITLVNYAFAAGTAVDFSAWVTAPNASTDAYTANDSLAQMAGASMSGIVTIDANLAPSATNFVTISNFTEYLNNFGVCGPTTATIASGIYNENISLRDVEGSSALNPIIIDGVDSSTTVLSYGGSGLGIGVVSLQGVEYVTIKNLGLTHTGSSNAAGVILADAHFNTLSNCNIVVDNSTTSSSVNGIVSSAGIFGLITGSNTNRNEFSNNVISGGYYGYREYGSATTAVIGNKILNNEFNDIYYYGVYFYYSDSAEVVGNVVDVLSRSNINGDGATVYYTSNVIFSGNDIKAVDYGVYFYNYTTPFKKTRKTMISNNMIYSDTDYGLYLYYIDSVNVYHNSVAVNGSSPASRLYGSTSVPTDSFDIRNNIFYSGGGAVAFESYLSDTLLSAFDYNLYYTSGSNLISVDGLSYSNLLGYTTANPTLNVNSVEGDPQFFNLPFDLHVLGVLANNSGDNSVGIAFDIDGDARPITGSTIVDMGADEFDPPTCPPPSSVAFTNTTINSVDVTFGGSATSTFRFEYGLIGFTRGAGASVLITSTSTTISTLASGTGYELYVKEICSASDSSVEIGPYQFGTAFSIPLHEGFETFTAGQVGTSFTNGWSSTGSTNPRWESEDATGANENSTLTGPFFDATTPSTIGGLYMFLETSSPSTLGQVNTLSSPSIFIPANGNTLVLEYAYHMFGSTMGNLYVVIDTNNVLDTVATYIGAQQAAQADAFKDTMHLLNGYSGKALTIKFIGEAGSSYYSDMAIDEVHLYDTVGVDLAMDSIISPSSNCGLSAAEDVTIAIKNSGLSSMTNFNATYIYDGGTPVTEVVTATVNPGTTYNFTFSAKVNASVVKGYTLETFISAPGDGDVSNDSITNYTFSSSFAQAVNQTFPGYLNDFEGATNNWVTYGTNNSWEIGTPNTFFISGPAGGSNAYVTSAASNHNANELSYIETPCFDLSYFIATDPFDISFKALFKTESDSDQVWMEMTMNNGVTWTKVMPDPVLAINFYNNATDNTWDGFSSAGAGNYIPVLNSLVGIGGVSQVKFRFVFKSNGTNENDGFAIDDFALTSKLYTGVGSTSLDASSFGLYPNPANENVTISFNNVETGNYSLTIEDVKGQKVVNEVIALNSNNSTKVVNTSQFEKGVYFVRLVNGSSIVTKKLVVN